MTKKKKKKSQKLTVKYYGENFFSMTLNIG